MKERYFGPYNKKYLRSNRFLIPFEEIEKLSEEEEIQIEHEKYWNNFYDELYIIQERERWLKFCPKPELRNIIFDFDTKDNYSKYLNKCANIIINVVSPFYRKNLTIDLEDDLIEEIKIPIVWIACLCYEHQYGRCDYNHAKQKITMIINDIHENINSTYKENYNLIYNHNYE